MKRALRWGGAIVVIWVGLGLLVWALRGTLVAPWLTRALIAAARDAAGLELRIGAVGGSYWSDLVLEDVRTLRPAAQGLLRSVEARRLEVSYDLFSLLSGVEPFIASTVVDLSGGRLELVPETEKSNVAKEPETASRDPALPGALPTVTVRESSLRLQGPDYRVEAANVALHVRPRPGVPTAIELDAGTLSWNHPALAPQSVSLRATLQYSPKFILLQLLTVDGALGARDVRVDLTALPETVSAGGEVHLFGAKTTVQAQLEADRLAGGITLAGLDLQRCVAVLQQPPVTLAGRLDGAVSVRIPLDQPHLLEATLSARLTHAQVGRGAIQDLTLEAEASRGNATVRSLRAVVGRNQVEVRDAVVPIQAALDGQVEVLAREIEGSFRGEWTDIASLFQLADLEVPQVPVPAHRVTFAGALGQGLLTLSQLEVATEANRFAGQGLSAPLAALAGGQAEPLLRSVRGAFRADVRDLPALATLAGGRPPPAIAAASVHHLVLAGKAESGRLELSEGRLLAEAAEISLAGASLDLSARTAATWRDAALAAALSLEVRDLAVLHALLGGSGAKGALRGQVRLSGTLGTPRGSIQLAGRELGWKELPLGAITVEAAADLDRVEVSSLVLTRDGDRLRGRGTYRRENRHLSDVRLEGVIEDLSVYTRPLVPEFPLTGGWVEGRLELTGPLLAPQGQFSLQAKGASVHGVAVDQLAVRVRASGDRVRCERLALQTGEGDLLAAGELTLPPADGVHHLLLDTLRLARDELELSLVVPARFTVGRDGQLAVDFFFLSGTPGSLGLRGSYHPQGAVDLTLELTGVNGEGWLQDLVGGKATFHGADLRAHLGGTAARPVVAASGKVAALHSEGVPFPLRGHFDVGYGPGGFALRRIELRGDLGTGLRVSGHIPYDPLAGDPILPGPLSLHLSADVPSLGPLTALFLPDYRIDGFFKASIDVEGTCRAPRGKIRFSGANLLLPSSWQPRPSGPLAVAGALDLVGERVALELLRVQAAELQLLAEGGWSHAPPLSDLLRGDVGVLSGDLSLRAQLNSPDLSWLGKGVEGLRGLGGRARAEVSVQGSPADLRFTGLLELANGEVLVNGPLPGIRSLSGRISADPAGVYVESVQGELGGAPFHLTGKLLRQGDGAFSADLQLAGEDLLLFRNDGVKLRADTRLHVAGDVSALAITGELALTDGRLVKNVDFLSLLQGTSPPKHQGGLPLFSFPDAPLKDARLDLAVTAKAPFRIKNNVARGDLRPDLRLSGTGEIPVVLGTVYLGSIRLRLPAGQLVVQSGVVRFLPSAPDRPSLDLLARARLLGYDIAVQVEGPYDEPVVTLSASPPLPDEDLLLLLLAGVPPRSRDGEAASQQSGMMMATYLGRTMLGQVFGEQSTEAGESILDRFELAVGQGITQKGEETIEVSFRFKEDVLRKGDTWYLRSEKDVYDAYNAGLRIVFRFE